MNAFAQRGAGNLGSMLKRGSRPRSTFGAMVGTAVCFVAFVQHYMQASDDSVVWVWFGMRSDGRCGRDFGTEHVKETACGKGLCCSSHGWCGAGEEYCSVALGCQSGCYPSDGTEDEQKHTDASEDGHHEDRRYVDDDGGYHSRGGGHYDDDSHGHPYRGHHDYHPHNDDRYDDYHHRYDSNPDDEPLDDHWEEHRYDDHGEDREHGHHHGDHHGDDHNDDGPELVGMHEKRHLGEGDGIPLDGEDGGDGHPQ